MNTKLSPYQRPWVWMLRETLAITLLVLAAWAVEARGFTGGIPQFLFFAGLIAVMVTLTMRIITDILVAGFCQWSESMGHGLGGLVAAIRNESQSK
jgi:hypothetical protein